MGILKKNKKEKSDAKVKTKRPLWLRIIVAIISFFLFCIISLCFLLIITKKTIDNLGFDKELLLKPFEHAKIGEIKVGGMFNYLEIGNGFDKDADIAECIYALLPPETSYLFTEEELREAINASDALVYFVGKHSVDYLYVAAGKDEETCISNEDVMELIKEYEPIIAGIVGSDRIFTDSMYLKMKEGLEKTRIEKYTRLDRDMVTKELEINLVETINETKDIGYSVAVFGIVVSVIILILIDLRRKRRIFMICGMAAFISSLVASLFLVMLDAFYDRAVERFPYAKILFEEVRDIIKNAFVNACGSVRSLGLILILVYIGIRIWQHIRFKKQKKSEPAQEKT